MWGQHENFFLSFPSFLSTKGTNFVFYGKSKMFALFLRKFPWFFEKSVFQWSQTRLQIYHREFVHPIDQHSVKPIKVYSLFSALLYEMDLESLSCTEKDKLFFFSLHIFSGILSLIWKLSSEKIFESF